MSKEEIVKELETCDHDWECTLDTDTWSEYTCKKCGEKEIEDFED